MGHNGSPYDYIIHVGIIATFTQSHTSLNNSFQPSLDYMHPKLDNECTGHPVVNLIAQVVNTSGSIWAGGMTSDWVLLLTRGHVHTHTRVCTHTTKCSALAWSLHIISHTTPLHLAECIRWSSRITCAWNPNAITCTLGKCSWYPNSPLLSPLSPAHYGC